MPSSANDSSRTIRILVVVLVAVVVALALALAGCGGETTAEGTPGADGAGGESATTVEEPMTSTSAEDAASLLIGKWLDAEGNEFEFMADGKFASKDTENINMTYVVEGDEIMFKSDFGEGMTIKYSLDGDTLTIEDPETGEVETATRVK